MAQQSAAVAKRQSSDICGFGNDPNDQNSSLSYKDLARILVHPAFKT